MNDRLRIASEQLVEVFRCADRHSDAVSREDCAVEALKRADALLAAAGEQEPRQCESCDLLGGHLAAALEDNERLNSIAKHAVSRMEYDRVLDRAEAAESNLGALRVAAGVYKRALLEDAYDRDMMDAFDEVFGKDGW